jgi:cell division protease FtsH
MLPSQDKTHRVSIVPRGHALGYTLHLPEEDRYLKTREEMVDWMVVALGGRVAEHVVFGDVTTGAANDLAKVYEVSRKMVSEYGMGTMISSRRMPADDYSVSEATRRMVDEEQQELTDLAWRRAHKLIEEHRDALEEIAAELLSHEVLERETIEDIMQRHREGIASVPSIAAAEGLDSQGS